MSVESWIKLYVQTLKIGKHLQWSCVDKRKRKKEKHRTAPPLPSPLLTLFFSLLLLSTRREYLQRDLRSYSLFPIAAGREWPEQAYWMIPRHRLWLWSDDIAWDVRLEADSSCVVRGRFGGAWGGGRSLIRFLFLPLLPDVFLRGGDLRDGRRGMSRRKRYRNLLKPDI